MKEYAECTNSLSRLQQIIILISTDHTEILGGNNVIDTILAIEWVLEVRTGGFGLTFSNSQFIKTSKALATGSFG